MASGVNGFVLHSADGIRVLGLWCDCSTLKPSSLSAKKELLNCLLYVSGCFLLDFLLKPEVLFVSNIWS